MEPISTRPYDRAAVDRHTFGVHAIDDLLQAGLELLEGGVAGDVIGAFIEDHRPQADAVEHLVLQAEHRRRAVAVGKHDAVPSDRLVQRGRVP